MIFTQKANAACCNGGIYSRAVTQASKSGCIVSSFGTLQWQSRPQACHNLPDNPTRPCPPYKRMLTFRQVDSEWHPLVIYIFARIARRFAEVQLAAVNHILILINSFQNQAIPTSPSTLIVGLLQQLVDLPAGMTTFDASNPEWQPFPPC